MRIWSLICRYYLLHAPSYAGKNLNLPLSCINDSTRHVIINYYRDVFYSKLEADGDPELSDVLCDACSIVTAGRTSLQLKRVLSMSRVYSKLMAELRSIAPGLLLMILLSVRMTAPRPLLMVLLSVRMTELWMTAPRQLLMVLLSVRMTELWLTAARPLLSVRITVPLSLIVVLSVSRM